jgi:predicted transcriptional regulator
MKNIEEIRKKLEDKRLHVVSRETGISYPTLLAIREGDNKNPQYKTIQKIINYLERK